MFRLPYLRSSQVLGTATTSSSLFFAYFVEAVSVVLIPFFRGCAGIGGKRIASGLLQFPPTQMGGFTTGVFVDA